MLAQLWSRPFSERALLVLLAVCLGVLAAANSSLALAGSVAFVVGACVLANLALGVALFAFLVALAEIEIPGVADPAVTVIKALGLLLILSWLFQVTFRADAQRRGFMNQRGGITVLTLFLAWVALSTLWAVDASAVLDSFSRYIQNVFLFFIVYTALRRPADATRLAGAVVAGAAVTATVALLTPPDPEASTKGGVERITGTAGDPNELAALLVAALPLAVFLASSKSRGRLRPLTALAAALLCIAGIFATVSRGGLIALGVALLAALFVAGRWRPKAGLAVGITLASALVYFSMVPAAVERVTRLEGGTGRSDIWTVGWRMVRDNPVSGVGAGNFEQSGVKYLLEPGGILRSDLIVDEAKVAHNTYLHIFAELGLVGLLLFIGVICFSLACALRAARITSSVELEALARGVFVSLVGLLTADFFISEQFSKQLWLLLGFAPALLALAKEEGGTSVAQATERESVRSQLGWSLTTLRRRP